MSVLQLNNFFYIFRLFNLLTGSHSVRHLLSLSLPLVANSLTSWMHFNFLAMYLANKWLNYPIQPMDSRQLVEPVDDDEDGVVDAASLWSG